MRRSVPPPNFLNPKPFGKYSRFTAKNAEIEPIIAIDVAAKPTLAMNRLKDIKLPITERRVTNIRRIRAVIFPVLSRFKIGSHVKNSAIGPLKRAVIKIITTQITSDSMVKG